MTSEPNSAFVWLWRPGAAEPVVAGRLDIADVITFTYARSYLDRSDAIALYVPDLPLEARVINPIAGDIPGPIADAGPDAWGQRVILNGLAGRGVEDTAELNHLTYLLESGSDRIGALDFQASATDYVPRSAGQATLDELVSSAERVEAGIPLSSALDGALLHGSSIGGARPKALLNDGSHRLIAKFSSSSDSYPVVRSEFLAMELGLRAGLEIATVELTQALGRDVLLIDRFDRPADGSRRLMVSALTILGLWEMTARHATYWELADIIRARFTDPGATLRELFSRIVFNVLVSNTDDHARNHAAFWDGSQLTLTPAYDIAPQARTGGEAQQIMAIGRDGFRYSQLAGCIAHAGEYKLSQAEAKAVVDHQIEVISSNWNEVCDLARLTEVERRGLAGRQFLNPYAFYDYTPPPQLR